MEVKASLVTVLLLACIGTALAESLTISRYTDVMDRLYGLTLDNACQQLQEIKQQLEDIITDSGLRPDSSKPFCHDEDQGVSFCSLLDGSMSSPMMGSQIPSLCSSYLKIKACDVKECGPSGTKFSQNARFEGSSSGSSETSCPQKASRDFVNPVSQITAVTKDTCMQVASALGSFRKKLDDCGGLEQEQLAVDIVQNGLAEHLQLCREKNYPVDGGEVEISSGGSGKVEMSRGGSGEDPTYTVMTASDYVSFSKFVNVGSLLNSLTVEQGCSQLQTIKQDVEDLITESGLRPDTSEPFCHSEEPYPYCSILSLAKSTPVLGEARPSLCSSYMKIKTCFDEECGLNGKRFDGEQSRNKYLTSSEESCPKEAVTICLQPVAQVSEVNSKTCIDMVKAKMCYIGKLSRCGGFSEEQLASRIILVGILQHIEQCKDDKQPLSEPGVLCVPDPLDTYVPRDYVEKLMKGPKSQTLEARKAFLKENCPTVESIGSKLDEYMRNCDVTPHLDNFLSDVISNLNVPRLMCMKEGFNLPPRDCPGNASTQHPTGGAMMALLSVAVLRILAHLFQG